MNHTLTNTLKNQPNFAVKGLQRPPGAQASTPLHADSARGEVIAKAAPTEQQKLQTQANNLVGQTFFAALLKQMHDSPFKSELFSGGKGGEAFNGLYDQQMAQRMAQRSGARLTRPIVRKYKAAAAKIAYDKANQKRFDTEATDVPHDRRA